MPDTSEDKQDRLSSIWAEWGLQPDTATGDALRVALPAADEWLKKGSSDPEIVIRAVQVLLVDPERPDAHKRHCWGSLRRAIRGAWGNVLTAPEHVLYGQALILAVWPEEIQGRWFSLASLLDSAWDLVSGRKLQQDEVARWRETARQLARRGRRQVPQLEQGTVEGVPYGGMDLSGVPKTISAIQRVQDSIHAGAQLVQVLNTFQSALSNVDNVLRALPSDTHAVVAKNQELNGFIESFLINIERETNFLWWGQARYCETLRIPLRRIQPSEDVVWWAAREAAEHARDVDVEPAAAYLVETLHDLGQDVFEKRSLLQWMEDLHASLRRTSSNAPALSERLARYAREDALGLPVTWVRLRTAQKEPLEGAAEQVGLDLKAEIDRGQWASWIFRECLLDLHLTGDS